MADWIQIRDELNGMPRSIPDEEAYTQTRHKYVKALHEQTKRNVITYYSGWTQHPNLSDSEINETDKSAFMTLTRGVTHGAGLDLFLHTPGGDVAATESIIDFLRDVYGANIRAFVIQLAMSAGTMIACACKEIIMGRQSSLGPVDPQMGGDTAMPAHSLLEEFEKAKEEIISNPKCRFVWEPILNKYPPTLIDQCEQHIKWSRELVEESLLKSMFKCDKDKESKAHKIAKALTDASTLRVHKRHLSRNTCKAFGLNVRDVYELAGHDYELKETIYAIHWANIHTLESQPIMKIIENHEGKSIIRRPIQSLDLP